MDATEPRHPINYVAKRCGLSTHAIRVWERRYGAVKPVRTGKNRRLYSDADIERLRLLKIITTAGHSIGHIATLPESELWALATASGVTPSPSGRQLAHPAKPASHDESPDAFLDRCRDAVIAMDVPALEQALLDASVALPQLHTLEHVVAPLMRWVGNEWHEGRIRVAHEHLASATVGRFLAHIRATYPEAGPGPVIAVTTPSGQQHEIGAQLAALVAAMHGWRDVYFGANLPSPEIARAARETGARAVALSVAFLGDNGVLAREIHDLRRMLPTNVALLLGGVAASRHRAELEAAGAHCVDSLTAFRDSLESLSAAG